MKLDEVGKYLGCLESPVDPVVAPLVPSVPTGIDLENEVKAGPGIDLEASVTGTDDPLELGLEGQASDDVDAVEPPAKRLKGGNGKPLTPPGEKDATNRGGRRRGRPRKSVSNSSNNIIPNNSDIVEGGPEPGKLCGSTPPLQTQSDEGASPGVAPAVVIVKQSVKGKWRERRAAASAFVNTVESKDVNPSSVLVTEADVNHICEDFRQLRAKHKSK